MKHRLEHDSMGEVRIPADALYGAQTQRAIENFPISGVRLERRMIRALARIKAEAARVNGRLAEIDRVTPAIARAIASAADEVAEGGFDDAFPIDVFQTGSGTSSNMNMNEVVARLASQRLGQPIHPNDHVNACQSSNDVFPSAIHIAATEAVVMELKPALALLVRALREKSRAFADVVKPGRTHLMDATPVTLGQELGGYAEQIRQALERFDDALPRLAMLPLGGTATGTGLNAPPSFAPRVLRALAKRTGLPLTRVRDPFAGQGARDGLVEASAAARGLAVALLKITSDLRWMNSGPRAGLAEIRLPELQPGSSIMPGKVNPVIPEAVAQVAAQVIGHDATIALCGSQGAFELNTFMPVMARSLLESLRILANACRLLAERCIRGMTADAERCRSAAERSPAIATALAPRLGYELTAEVVKQALAQDRPIRDVVLERKLMKPAEVDKILDLRAMARGGLLTSE